MNKLDKITENYPDESFLSADGFEDAIIGVVYDKAIGTVRLAYSITKCIEILKERDGMSYDDAFIYFDFNVINAYVGEKTPIWVDDEIL